MTYFHAMNAYSDTNLNSLFKIDQILVLAFGEITISNHIDQNQILKVEIIDGAVRFL